MGAMKDLSIEIDEYVHQFEENFRDIHGVSGQRSNQEQTALKANAYDAFYNLKDVVDRLLGVGEGDPVRVVNNSVYNTYPEDSDDVRAELRELSAQIAAMVQRDIDIENEEPADEQPVEHHGKTGQTLHVSMADGSAYSIEDVDQFHMTIDKTGEWPIGWVYDEDPDDDPNAIRKAGYWDNEGVWFAFDSRYRNPAATRFGW